MNAIDFKNIRIGESLPPLVKGPLDREQIKLYAQASGDFNPIHLEDDVARKAGLPGVIAHGMLSMAFIGEYLYSILNDPMQLESFNCRFRAKTFPGDVITISGKVKSQSDSRALIELETRNQQGEITTTGQAEIRWRY